MEQFQETFNAEEQISDVKRTIAHLGLAAIITAEAIVLGTIAEESNDENALYGSHESIDYSRVHVVTLSDPASEKPDSYTEDGIRRAFTNAKDTVSAYVSHAASFSFLPKISRYEKSPSGVMNDETACYTQSDFNDIQDDEAKKTANGNNEPVAIILQNTVGCPSGGGSHIDYNGIASRRHGKAPQLAIQAELGYTYQNKDEAPNSQTIIHEYGHMRGLTHVAEIACLGEKLNHGFPSYYTTHKQYLPVLDVDSVVNLCGVVTKPDGNVDEYFPGKSIMGGDHTYLFNAVERNRLDDAAYPLEAIDLDRHKRYFVGLHEGETQGISFKIPNDHSLKTVDDTIDTVTIALQPPQEDDWKFTGLTEQTAIYTVTASGANLNYDIYSTWDNDTITNQKLKYLPKEVPEKEQQKAVLDQIKNDNNLTPLLYMDHFLGIAVFGGYDVTSEKNYVEILSINDPTAKRRIGYTKKAADERAKLIEKNN